MKRKITTQNKKRGILYWGRKQWQLYIMILPAVLYLILFVYKPMGGLVIAFQDYSLRKGIQGSEWVGFDNFFRLFRSYWFPVILKK